MNEVEHVMALASVLATARVRRYAVYVGRAPNETQQGVDKRVDKATAELRAAVEALAARAPGHEFFITRDLKG